MSSERHAELIAEIATLTAENETLRRRVQELEALLADKEAPEKAAAADTEDTEATQNTRDAIQCLDAAQAATGSATFLSAGDLIADGSTKNAAVVLTSIMRAHELCDAEAKLAVKAAQRAVRDILVIRLRAQVPPGDREAFLKAAADAFGYPIVGKVREQLLLACSKTKDKRGGFLSNNAQATARRGRGRPRRNRDEKEKKRSKSMPPRVASVPPAWVQIPEWASDRIRTSSSWSPRMVNIERRETGDEFERREPSSRATASDARASSRSPPKPRIVSGWCPWNRQEVGRRW